MHCGCSGVRCLCSFLDRLRPSDTDALRNPQRQLASDRFVFNFEYTMKFWIPKYKLESKEIFHNKIEKYYSELAGTQIPSDLMNELIDKITDSQYDNYKRFWKQYPKSRKRYSTLRLEDLEHSFTYFEISDFFKHRDFENYKKYSMILLKMTDEEFNEYEIRKYQYETK